MTRSTPWRLGLAGTVVAIATAVIGWASPASMVTATAAPAAAASSPHHAADTVPHAPTREENVAMVEQLAERLKTQPNDLDGWQQLSRAYSIMGREQVAVAAHRRVVALAPKDAQAHADLARAIGNTNGRKLNPEAEQLLKTALELDPRNVMAHALLGRSALDRGQPALAKRHWEDALAGLDPEHPFAAQLRSAIQIAGAGTAAASASTR
jgi:cytochrome c-type biogenesis protein CcmH